MKSKNQTKAKVKSKTEVENTEEKLYLGLMNNLEELNILNLYNMEFCRELKKEKYEVILGYANPWCSDYYAFSNYLIDLNKNNTECQQAYDGFVDRGITVTFANNQKKCLIPRLDIFYKTQYIGAIFLGICVEEINGKTKQSAHSVFLAREDAKEKLQNSRAKAHSKIIENPKIKSLIKKEIVKDSLNPEKYPIVEIDVSSLLKLLKSTHFI